MSIAPLVLPDIQDAPEYHAQAVPDPTDLQLVAGLDGAGWESGCQVTATVPPTFAVAVASGAVGIGGVVVNVTANPALACLAPSITDRRDVVLVGADGLPYMKAGVACPVDPQSAHWSVASSMLPPLKPRADANTVVLAEVYVAGGSPPAAINGGSIVDKRTPFRPFQTPVPATAGSPLTTQGGEVLDDGSGNATFPGTVTAKAFNHAPGSGVIDVTAQPYGAKGDRRSLAGAGSMTAGSAVLASTTNVWLITDVGKAIGVYGAGVGGAPLITTIQSWQSAGQVTLAAPAVTTVATARFSWGTDNTGPIQHAMADVMHGTQVGALAIGGEIDIPPGDYLVAGFLDMSGLLSVLFKGDNGQAGRGSVLDFLNFFNSRVITATLIVAFAANTTNGSATITNCTPALTAADVGRTITGPGIPAKTIIDQVGSPGTSATLKNSDTLAPALATATASQAAMTLGGPFNFYTPNGNLSAGDVTSTIRLPGVGYFAAPWTSLTFVPDVVAASAAALPTYDYDSTAGTLTGHANGALPNIDGVVPVIGMRFLLQHGGTASVNSFTENGIYVVTDPGSTGTKWVCTRTTDVLASGTAVTCTGGDYNANKLFYLRGDVSPPPAGQWASSQAFVSNLKAVVSANVGTLHNPPSTTVVAQEGVELGLAQMRFAQGVAANGCEFENIRFQIDPIAQRWHRGAIFSGYLTANVSWGPVTFRHCTWGIEQQASDAVSRHIVACDTALCINSTQENPHFSGGRHGWIWRNNVNHVSGGKAESMLGSAGLNCGQNGLIDGDFYVEPYFNQCPDALFDWDQVLSTSATLKVDSVWVGDLTTSIYLGNSASVRWGGAGLTLSDSLLAGGDNALIIAGTGSSRLYMKNVTPRGGTVGIEFLVAQTGAPTKIQYAELVANQFPVTPLVNAQNCLEIASRGNNNLPDFGGGAPLYVNANTVDDTSFPAGYVPPNGTTAIANGSPTYAGGSGRFYTKRNNAWHYYQEAA